jgi:hypothetical protein
MDSTGGAAGCAGAAGVVVVGLLEVEVGVEVEA